MVYKAYELLAKLRILKLVGQDHLGNLEWVGITTDWMKLQYEEESILRDAELTKI